MAKISALPAASAPNVTDSAIGFEYVDANTNSVRLTLAQARTQLFTSPTLLTFTLAGLILNGVITGTGNQYAQIGNTLGRIILGAESSAGGSIVAGSSAYDALLVGLRGLSVSADGGTTLHLRFATTGIATFAKEVITAASTVANAGFSLPHGTAPTSPVDGNLWTTTAGLFVRVNGVTVGPLS